MSEIRTFAPVVAIWALIACGPDAAPDSGANGANDSGTTPSSDSGTAASTDSGGAPGPPPPALDAGGCGELGQSDVCTQCLARECCALETMCTGSDACAALVECARTCDYADAGDCRVGCVDEHSTGRPAYNELVLCMGQRCRAECPFTAP